MEQIYTIPVNEAFDACRDDPAGGCPICALYRRLEENELDLILGASMMEPDIRIRTNHEGFCRSHFEKMLGRQNRLSLALMLESHLHEVEEGLRDGFLGTPGDKPAKRAAELEKSCYLCSRIEASLSRMMETVVLLWESDRTFRDKFAAQHRFCLPHFRRLTELGRLKLSKKSYAAYYETLGGITKNYLKKLSDDVSWFCKKFDYRYQDEPWYDAKDALERTVGFLTATDGKAKEGKRK